MVINISLYLHEIVHYIEHIRKSDFVYGQAM